MADKLSSSSPLQNENKSATTPPIKVKRSKTFTGCFTCRSRKIKCDLTRPQCERCIKAGLTCAGYDIKLRWSLPIEFKPMKNGNVKSSQTIFPNKESTPFEDENATPTTNSSSEFFQRRLVGFVTWSKPYETYEDMDYHLGVLHNSSNDEIVKKGETKLLGPFGVFKGPNPSNLISKKRSKGEIVPRELKRVKNSTSNTMPPPAFVTLTPAMSINGTNVSSNAPHDQFWLSNELKDAALVTAAALDTQFLEMMNKFDNTNNYSQPNKTNNSNLPSNESIYDYNFNNPDLLNLVFHKSSISQPSSHSIPPSQSQANVQNSNMSMSSLLNHPQNLIDPIYYSNFSNFFYNNPYQMNENLEIQLHAKSTSHDDETTDFVDGDQFNDKNLLTSIMNIIQNPLTLPFDLSLKNSKNQHHVGIPITALQVQPLTRYLLNYYVTEVADLMTVIPLTENPWKAIYFPRALMAIGELSALGKTSTAKNALLNALLAVSAFNLQSKFPKNSEQMRFYLNLGISLRNQASLFVKQLLNNSKNENNLSGIEHCVNNEKYKDVLCAVMSMISVDLVWGTMQDTSLYISWCGKVIVAKMQNKKKLSSKARILHRIFSSLKLIQDSTCLNFDSIKDDFESDIGSGYDVNGDKWKQTSNTTENKKNRIDFIVNSTFGTPKSKPNLKSTTSPSFVNKKLINTQKNDENFATDALYGIPNSLIVLFSQIVEILRTKIYYKGINKSLSEEFKNKINELDTFLLNWTLDWELYENQDKDNQSDVLKFHSSMHEATYHHIMSFYYALLIYFNRFVKEVDPNKLQDKVIKTLEHLNSIQNLIAKDEANIIPLFWQGFIAGCEAISSDLQTGFKKWGADIAQYLGSYWGARQIMLEVWRRKRMQESRDDWVSVVQDWEMNLMLN
ncbi:unnamed protein product [Candida verbasci]|uniref:Zn(2)-C6 fungal-type domain-containing protein n=1 Tax=Candida verbasci TaxID=1227364 RepID=A0A9W4TT56_9ASCO|nr:unnamed protein product [Candida verbasci]